jgi:predicted dehydrogenase
MIRTAVIGVGAMGRNHARVYTEIPDSELVAVVDTSEKNVTAIAHLHHAKAYTDLATMLRETQPEAVTVAVPTQFHYSVVKQCLMAGCHVLVEKPIASSVAEGQELTAIAQQHNRRLMVGHIERFNPAVLELKRRLDAGELGRVFQIHTRRLGPFPARIQDVGVVLDLATHDLDIMHYLTGSLPSRIYAETMRQIHSSNEDLFSGMVRFSNDVLGVLEINWLTPSKIRELYVTGERGLFLANYLTQDLYFYENGDTAGTPWSTLSMLRGVTEGTMTRFAIQRKEPLRAELEAFIASIYDPNRTIVSGEDGLVALQMALNMIESGQTHLPIEVRSSSVQNIATTN